jgi:hypothetical protein
VSRNGWTSRGIKISERAASIGHNSTSLKNGGQEEWRCQWFTPVILGTQEEEIGRTVVQSQLGQIVPKILIQKISSQKRASGVAQGVGPEFKHQYCKKKKNDLEFVRTGLLKKELKES